jgi:alcohol dehydrogenase (cytochrome c)
VNGTQQPVVIGAGKGGEVVAFAAQTGAVLWNAVVGLHHNDAIQAIPAGQTITVLPGVNGGVQTPMALSGGVIYVPIINAAAQLSATQFVSDDTATGIGELDALDANTGQIRWVAHLNAPDVGGATVAGDLVITSTLTGQVLAFDRASGHQEWSWQAPGGINSPLTVVGNTVLVPVGWGKTPMLVALKLGAAGAA